MNSKVVKDGGGSMKSLSSGKKDSNTPHIDSGVDSGLSYRSQNSNSNSDSQCSDSASCNSTQCAQVKNTVKTYDSSILNPKMGRVFPMVVVSIPPHAVFGPNDHREDAPHFSFLFYERLRCKLD